MLLPINYKCAKKNFGPKKWQIVKILICFCNMFINFFNFFDDFYLLFVFAFIALHCILFLQVAFIV